MKGKTSPWVIIAVVAVVAVALGVVKIPTFSTVTPTQPTTQAPSNLLSNTCQTDGSNDVNVQTPNLLSTTASLYSAATISAYDANGAFIATGTSANTNAFTALSIPCSGQSFKGTAYALASTSGVGTLVNSAKSTYDVSNGALVQNVVIGVKNTTGLQLTIRSTALVNTSSPTATVNSANESVATAMTTGDTRSGYIDIQGNTGNSQFGSDDGGILWVVDTADSTVFSDKSISISSTQIALQEVACPNRAVSFDSGNRCYKSGAIKTSDGLVRVSWTMNADLGNPGASADPFIYLEDLQYFDEDSRVVQDFVNKGGTNIGLVRQQVGFDNS